MHPQDTTQHDLPNSNGVERGRQELIDHLALLIVRKHQRQKRKPECDPSSTFEERTERLG